MPFTLLIGGARSGKSSLAVRRARDWVDANGAVSRRVVFVATGSAGDEEMSRRIAAHRCERDTTWRTVEAPDDLLAGVREAFAGGPDPLLIVDCLSFWVANRLMRCGDGLDAWAEAERSLTVETGQVAELLKRGDAPSIVVTNEVGSGLVPDTAIGRQFRDTLGRINAVASLCADEAHLVVAGRTLRLELPC